MPTAGGGGPGVLLQRCPRCGSRDTKFCYYNNYNTSQPRHNCRTCRRYWTLGGTLRSVPIGGSSRKHARRHVSLPLAAAAAARDRRSGAALQLPVSWPAAWSTHHPSAPLISGGAGLDRGGFDLGLGLGHSSGLYGPGLPPPMIDGLAWPAPPPSLLLEDVIGGAGSGVSGDGWQRVLLNHCGGVNIAGGGDDCFANVIPSSSSSAVEVESRRASNIVGSGGGDRGGV